MYSAIVRHTYGLFFIFFVHICKILTFSVKNLQFPQLREILLRFHNQNRTQKKTFSICIHQFCAPTRRSRRNFNWNEWNRASQTVSSFAEQLHLIDAIVRISLIPVRLNIIRIVELRSPLNYTLKSPSMNFIALRENSSYQFTQLTVCPSQFLLW